MCAPLKFVSRSSLMAPTSSDASAKSVCVMDASGRLGSSLVERLLRLGYTVHASLFNHGDHMNLRFVDADAKGSALGTGERLKVFRSDPLDYHSIADAVRGCSGLFYNFEAPCEDLPQPNYDLVPPNAQYKSSLCVCPSHPGIIFSCGAHMQEFMVEMEVRTAHNVLEACAQTDTMERVVFTSSVTAVVWKEDRKSGDDFDERDWSDPNFCRKFKLWHALAKALSEKTAWALAMDRDVDMVSINAGLLTCPGVSASTPYLKGAPEMHENGVLVTVDLELLVDAHVCVYGTASAFGRYLCFNRAICRPEDAVKFSQMLNPSSPRPPLCDDLRGIQQRIRNRKLNKLMLECKSVMFVQE